MHKIVKVRGMYTIDGDTSKTWHSYQGARNALIKRGVPMATRRRMPRAVGEHEDLVAGERPELIAGSTWRQPDGITLNQALKEIKIVIKGFPLYYRTKDEAWWKIFMRCTEYAEQYEEMKQARIDGTLKQVFN